MPDPVVIACASDALYVRPLATMLRSLIDNLGAGRCVVIYIIQSGLDETQRAAVVEGWPNDRATAFWIDARDSVFDDLPLWGRMPVSTYYKLELPRLLPPHVTKAIWLDCDLLILDDIGALWDTDIGSHKLGAVQDAVVPFVSSRCGIAQYTELHRDASDQYFNAGVMIADVGAWRNENVREGAIAYLRRYRSSVVFWDQEGLNAAIAGDWIELAERWNQNVSIPKNRRQLSGKPAIAHFAGSLKPWRFRSNDPLRNLYYEYLDRTAFAGWRPASSVASTVVSLYEESGLRKMIYPAENIGMRMIRGMSRR
jgi:lipopolysaccharide biosynthesis glycosyltransferase